MKRARSTELNRLEVIQLCHSALDSRTLRSELLQRLRRAIPFDYAYFSITDPATQLSTSSVMVEEPPPWCMSVYVENEFLREDFNKFSDMMRQRQTVGILSETAGDELPHSHRYQEMLRPLGMEDELRAIFVSDGACWGTLCLHREKSRYSGEEAAYLTQLTGHIADGLRKALVLNSAQSAETPNGPGVLLLTEDLSIIATTSAAEYWLAELSDMKHAGGQTLPVPVRSVVAGLKAIERGLMAGNTMPKVRVHTRSGHWLMLYASRLNRSESPGQISVIFEVAQPVEIAPLIMQAYTLTQREGEVTQCVLRGLSTSEIAAKLHISPNTVQDHLKAIFEKVAVSSRGELAARIFRQL